MPFGMWSQHVVPCLTAHHEVRMQDFTDTAGVVTMQVGEDGFAHVSHRVARYLELPC
uniref:Uncharacterized protein n=1 Tax=Candidatus Methanogaster sp. ANME-2c ERB4 TaxID=2759911 RepID=A0A7G9YBJ9_9EURY|nr:hypothetical protein PLCHCCMC_00001 [Methanosarcinales archaeon ANME-2c ERB4]